MEERKLVPGDFYRHFKNKLYQIKCVAYHSETKEKMVVYQAMYGDFSVYVRPLDMFMSEVDHIKYPEVQQKYRFERVDISQIEQTGVSQNEQTDISQNVQTNVAPGKQVEANNEATKDSVEEGQVDSRLLMFLDADTVQDKLNVLAALRSKMDDDLINSIAISLDVVVPEGDIDKRFASLKSCLLMQAKYECTRLR